MDYAKAVTRGRFLLKRSTEDQWELAELTHSVIEEKGRGSAVQWAADLGCTKSHVSRLNAVWERYGKVEHAQLSFDEYYLLATVPKDEAQELAGEAHRTGRSVRTVQRNRREQRKAAREALLDRKQRKELLADANIRKILEREFRDAHRPEKPKQRKRDFAAEMRVIHTQLNDLFVEMLDRGLSRAEKREVLASLVEMQEVLVWMESYIKTGSRSFEDALEHMLEESEPPRSEPEKPARKPKPAPPPPVDEPAAEAEPVEATAPEPEPPRGRKPDREQREKPPRGRKAS